MDKFYTPKTWKNKPSTESPINEYWLNHMESGINESDNRIVRLDAEKLSREEAQKFVKSVTLDKATGVLTVTLADGTQTSVDLDIEKVVTNFDLDEENNLVLTLADGTKKKVPLSKFIDTYTFKSSPTVSFSANGKEITAVIPDGAVTLDKLETSIITTIRQYTLDAQTAKGQAEQAAQTAGGWAIGGLDGFENSNSKYFASQSKRYAVGGVEEGDTSDNAKYYCEEARKAAETASGAAGFDGTAATVSAIDTQDLTGVGKDKKSTVQALLDKIVQKLVEKVVTSDAFQTVLGKYLVNNGLTTEAGKFGLDAAFGKNLQDQITQQNSNLEDTGNRLESLSSDLNTVKTNVDPVKSSYIDNADTNILNRINLVVWDPDTASTPYKTGNTVYGNGFCITYSTGDQWLCQLAMAVGDPNLFTRYKRLGTWSGWTTIGTSSSV